MKLSYIALFQILSHYILPLNCIIPQCKLKFSRGGISYYTFKFMYIVRHTVFNIYQ